VALCAALWLLVREVPGDAAARSAWFWRRVSAIGKHGLELRLPRRGRTAAIISLQTWGQSRTTANEAAVVYAFEPAAAAFFGYFWLGEAMTARGWLGGLLISGMIVSQWNSEAGPPPRSPPSDDRQCPDAAS
jgi:hypothetical protein